MSNLTRFAFLIVGVATCGTVHAQIGSGAGGQGPPAVVVPDEGIAPIAEITIAPSSGDGDWKKAGNNFRNSEGSIIRWPGERYYVIAYVEHVGGHPSTHDDNQDAAIVLRKFDFDRNRGFRDLGEWKRFTIADEKSNGTPNVQDRKPHSLNEPSLVHMKDLGEVWLTYLCKEGVLDPQATCPAGGTSGQWSVWQGDSNSNGVVDQSEFAPRCNPNYAGRFRTWQPSSGWSTNASLLRNFDCNMLNDCAVQLQHTKKHAHRLVVPHAQMQVLHVSNLDKGQSTSGEWAQLLELPMNESVDEPYICEWPNDGDDESSLIMLLRTATGTRYLWSPDSGGTWAGPFDFGFASASGKPAVARAIPGTHDLLMLFQALDPDDMPHLPLWSVVLSNTGERRPKKFADGEGMNYPSLMFDAEAGVAFVSYTKDTKKAGIPGGFGDLIIRAYDTAKLRE